MENQNTKQINWQRFGKLIKTETLINKRLITSLLLALLLGMSLIYYFTNYIFEAGNPISKEYNFFYTTILYAIILIVPIFAFYNLYHKVKYVSYAMLPASQCEKFLSAIIQVGIIFPIILFAEFFLISLIIKLTSSQNTLQLLCKQSFYENIFHTLQIQSLIFLGMFWFKNNKIIKIILTFVIIIVTLSTFFTIFGYYMTINQQFYEFFVDLFIKLGFTESDSGWTGFAKFFRDYNNYILAIFIPLLPYLFAFRKFKKVQI